MLLDLPSQKKILFAPLYWGLGHTTRSIPIIREALTRGNTIWVAGNKIQEEVIQENIPGADIQFLVLPSYDIHYGKNLWSTRLRLSLQSPKIEEGIQREKATIEDWQTKYGFHTIISDARLGMYHPRAKSVLINHQMSPRYGYGRIVKNMMDRRVQNQMVNFDEIWVPDVQDDRLAGALSIIPPKLKHKSKYIGWLSQLVNPNLEKDNEYLFILSGVEPQKTQLQNWAGGFLSKNNRQGIIVGGVDKKDGIHIGHQNSKDLASWISRSKKIICRSGYSSLMDLQFFGDIQIYLSPTPGQPEQEYLYRYHIQQGNYLRMKDLS